MPFGQAGQSPITWWYGNGGNVDIDVANLLLTVPTNLSVSVDAPTFDGPALPIPRALGGTAADIYRFTATDLAPEGVRVLPVTLTAGSATTTLDMSAYVYEAPATLRTTPSEPIADVVGRVTRIGFQFPDTLHPLDGGHTGFISADGQWVYDFGQTPGQSNLTIEKSPFRASDWDAVLEVPDLADSEAQQLYLLLEDIATNPPERIEYTWDPFLLKAIELGFGTCHGFVEHYLELAGYHDGQGLVLTVDEERKRCHCGAS